MTVGRTANARGRLRALFPVVAGFRQRFSRMTKPSQATAFGCGYRLHQAECVT
ncbi:hypothetical protein PAMC26510_15950 [Caballeronia sordidicola]|uniref:Uncharacterized protein n=1 Tax=Caballeronia sordidicola TaxID=196367 RepID=A0A242MS65_CABSO|nr:hypothetical protein PAMC26577_16790 [Caballeronia sordidicola]OTP74876.1 hypothetical protein PAMC26510_15950 [Caballeronia sordidicola]